MPFPLLPTVPSPDTFCSSHTCTQKWMRHLSVWVLFSLFSLAQRSQVPSIFLQMSLFSLQLNKILSCLCIFLLIYPSLNRCLGLLVLAYKQYISKWGCACVLWSCYLRVLCGFSRPVGILSLASEKAPDFRVAMQFTNSDWGFSSHCLAFVVFLSNNSQADWGKISSSF